MKIRIFVCLAGVTLLLPADSYAQQANAQRFDAANRLIDAALRDSAAYRRLALLTDKFGPRMSGSKNLEDAIDWIVSEMKRDGFENVHTEPVMITHWVRGEESAELVSPRRAKLNMLGLGRSVATPARGITAPVLVVHDFAELRRRAGEAKGKLVLFNHAFDSTASPFAAYSSGVAYRAYGADSAAQFGAVGVLIRSVTPHSLNTPHTGGLNYADSARVAPKIPAAALTVENAEMLQRMQDRGERVVVILKMGAKTLPNAPSRNVVAEIRGSQRPNEVVVLGGHIDSWDVGTGAMDDGGGSVAAWEAARVILKSGVRPLRTIRVVLWTNEEIGLGGAFGYRDAHRSELPNHVLAMESDNGVFTPHGINYSGDSTGLPRVRELAHLLARIAADSVAAEGPEADVWPLNQLGVPTLAINSDPSRYFWYHHTEADTIDKIDPRQLAECVSVMAVMANTVANMEDRLPRAPVSK